MPSPLVAEGTSLIMRLVVTPEQAGQRLDKILAGAGFALRAARRLCAANGVKVNGVPRQEAWKLHAGDAVEWALPEERTLAAGAEGAALVLATGDLAALYKPAGLHTAALAGGDGASLEMALPRLLAGCSKPFPLLLNRLDFGTSGLVLVALNAAGLEAWKRGPVEKRYLALLTGDPREDKLIKKRLDLRHPRKTRVTEEDDPDPARHTRVCSLGPLGPLEPSEPPSLVPEPLTLAGCSIVRGARHQIRAHAAYAGFPLAGDERYGATMPLPPPWGGHEFLLHHGWLRLPGFEASIPPSWLENLPPRLAEAGRGWLRYGKRPL